MRQEARPERIRFRTRAAFTHACSDVSSAETEALSLGLTTNRAPACSASRRMTVSTKADTAILIMEGAASVIR